MDRSRDTMRDWERRVEATAPWRGRLHEIIFESDTPAGKAFDVGLLAAISISVLVVMLESVASVRQDYRMSLVVAEWAFTVLFTIEYVVRLLCVRRPLRYALSFFGIVDFLAVAPVYLAALGVGTHYGIVIRSLRLLRVFRIFKLGAFVDEAIHLRKAFWASRAKITVFLATVVTIVVIVGAAMHVIEGPEHGFTSIPRSVYWAIVTMTTVGYGTIVPTTLLGQSLSALMMVLGYSLIVVPTGFVTVGMMRSREADVTTEACPDCARQGHDHDADFCKYCGAEL
jgi:voltage-gated potassium channel